MSSAWPWIFVTIAGALLGLATTLFTAGLWERTRLRLLLGLAHLLQRLGGEPTPGSRLNFLNQEFAALNRRLIARIDLLRDPDEVVELVLKAKKAETNPDDQG